MSKIIIVDAFYSDPESIRQQAINSEYKADGIKFPGLRSTKTFLSRHLKQKIKQTIPYPIQWSLPNLNFNGCFQIITEKDNKKSYIHADVYMDWVGLIYLSQGYEDSPGTIFYQHKLTGFSRWPDIKSAFKKATELNLSVEHLYELFIQDRINYQNWIPVQTIPYEFNRLVLYPAQLFHKNSSGWGDKISNGRLTQLLFFKLKKVHGRSARLPRATIVTCVKQQI